MLCQLDTRRGGLGCEMRLRGPQPMAGRPGSAPSTEAARQLLDELEALSLLLETPVETEDAPDRPAPAIRVAPTRDWAAIQRLADGEAGTVVEACLKGPLVVSIALPPDADAACPAGPMKLCLTLPEGYPLPDSRAMIVSVTVHGAIFSVADQERIQDAATAVVSYELHRCGLRTEAEQGRGIALRSVMKLRLWPCAGRRAG